MWIQVPEGVNLTTTLSSSLFLSNTGLGLNQGCHNVRLFHYYGKKIPNNDVIVISIENLSPNHL